MAAVAVTAPTDELTDELARAFLEALERSGSIRGSARAIGVDRWTVRRRRCRDPQFAAAWDAIRTRRLQSANDELFAAIAELRKLIGGYEYALDELVNVAFDATQEQPRRRDVDAIALVAARERLYRAGRAWAAVVAMAPLEPELEHPVEAVA